MFSETVRAAAAAANVSATLLCFMNFRDAPRRWWTGFGALEAGGHSWQGLGQLVTIDGLEASYGTGASPTTFTLSGVDAEIVSLARSGSDRVKGRRVIVYIQFFYNGGDYGAGAGQEMWGLLDAPTAIWSGRMDQIKFSAQGPSQRTITVTAENLWVDRNRPPFGFYTPQDQRGRFPGDKGLDEVPALASKTIHWPDF